MKKISISLVGAGQVGCQIAMLLQQTPWAKVTFADMNLGRSKGRCLDIGQAGAIHRSNHCMQAKPVEESIKDAQVIVVSAGIPRTPDMSREDLIKRNAQTIHTIGDMIYSTNPEAFVILVTNPVDVLTWVLTQKCGLDPQKTMGLSGALDGGRFAYFLSQTLNIHPSQIHTTVIGPHSDAMMILQRYTTVSGINLPTLKEMGLISQEAIDECIHQAVHGGATIIKLLENMSTSYGPAAGVFEMIQAIVFDQRKMISCSHLLKGTYGTHDLCLSTPVILGGGGIEQSIELRLSEDEQDQWNQCAQNMQKMVSTL
jgi:malate dehydrogenase